MLKKVIAAITQKIILAMKRFPIPMLCAVIFCIILVSASKHDIDNKGIYLATLFCGCFLFIALKLFFESNHWSISRHYMIGIPIFLAIAGYLYNASNVWLVFTFLGLGLFLSMFTAPFLKRNTTSAQFWYFSYYLGIHICFTILIAIIVVFGISAIIGSLSFLFGLTFYNYIYLDILIIVATLFAPIFAMVGIPEKFDIVGEKYPRGIQTILSYIMLPLLLIYSFILHAYIAKIILAFSLPKGGVAYMVTAFGCIGIATYLVSQPLHSSQGIISLFGRHFFKILLLPLILLITGITVRINTYGVTEERYAILLCVVWFVLTAFFTLTKYREQSPKFIFFSLVLLLIMASFGPWGAVSISARSQLHRLEALLIKNNILIDDHIHVAPQALNHADHIAVASILEYVVDTNKIELIKPWFTTLPNAHIHQRSNDLNAQDILRDMGIDKDKVTPKM